MSNVAESGEEHSIIWGMFMAATMNAATLMGKNFSPIQSFVTNSEDLFEGNVRYHRAIGERLRGDQWFGQNSLGKEFMETTVTDW